MLADLRQYISHQINLSEEAELLKYALENSTNEELVRSWVSAIINENLEEEPDLGIYDIFVEKVHLQDWIDPMTFQSVNPFQDLVISTCSNNFEISSEYFEMSWIDGISSSRWKKSIPLKIRKKITKDFVHYINDVLPKDYAKKMCRTFYGTTNRSQNVREELEDGLSSLDTICAGYSYVTSETEIDELMTELGYDCLGSNRYYISYLLYTENYDGHLIECNSSSIKDVIELERAGKQKERDLDIDHYLSRVFCGGQWSKLSALMSNITNIKINRKDVIM